MREIPETPEEVAANTVSMSTNPSWVKVKRKGAVPPGRFRSA